MGLYGGGGSAPKPDKNMGIAALKSAETGEKMLEWAKGQSEVTNRWASEDRDRYKRVFQPRENQFVEESWNYDTPARRGAEAARARADVIGAASQERAATNRAQQAMGVRPDSGRALALNKQADMATSLAAAGASNQARRTVEEAGYARKANAVNLGKGMAVNPGTSMGLSNSSGAAGFSGAMSGYGQQASILGQEHGQRMQAWQADQNAANSMMSGFGMLAGAGMSIFSSKDAKTDKTPARGSLGAIRKMPVEDWTYKEGKGDGGRHRGAYAEDFQKATGLGDGKTINVIDAIGTTMGAIRELDQKVDRALGVRPKKVAA